MQSSLESPLSSQHSMQGDFVVREPGRYAIFLAYRYDTQKAREAAWQLAHGAVDGKPLNVEIELGRIGPRGTPTSVHQFVRTSDLSSWGQGFLEKELLVTTLPRGSYHVRIRYFGPPAPYGVTLSAGAKEAYRGK